jgi:asparagine synthase (glutamine-hydrolysing)
VKLCGIFDFDTRPLSEADESRVRTSLYSPGSIAPQTCRLQGLFMGWTGDAAPFGPEICRGPDRTLCLFDGRIDNRKALLEQGGLRPDSPNAALILSCYRNGGVDGLRHAIGDWSLCIWNPERREILLASDYAGIRPLYYHRTEHRLCWSSSLADLVDWTATTDLDESYIAGFLSGNKTFGRTLYAGIVPVPAGHAVSMAGDRSARRAFWTLPFHQETRYRDGREYEERLCELFRESVAARLSSDGPTCAELSGGLDSSSIVCMADRVRRENPGSPSLITISYTSPHSADETFYREVERSRDVSPLHLDLQEYPAFAADRIGEVPGLWEPRFQGLARLLDSRGSRVLLTGQLGDFIMGNTRDDIGQVTESLATLRIVKALRSAYGWSKSKQVPVYPVLWRSVREAYLSWVPPTGLAASVGAMAGSAEDSISDRLRACRPAREIARDRDDWTRRVPPGRRFRFRSASDILQSRALETPAALQGISYAHPYAHRPLVEFLLTIPAEVVVAPGEPRRLMRRAFADLLPPLVLNRKSKASYEPAYRAALRPLAVALLKSPDRLQLVERGYVDRPSLIGRLVKFTQGLDCNEVQLRQILQLEFWLRQHAEAPRAAYACAQ